MSDNVIVEMGRTARAYFALWPGYFDNVGQMRGEQKAFAFVGLVAMLPVMLIIFLSFFTISMPFYVISKADAYRQSRISPEAGVQ